jgi:hypothetical protein
MESRLIMKTFKSLQEAREWKNPDLIKYEVVPVTFKSVDGAKYMVKLRDERFATKSADDDDFEAMLREYGGDEEGLEEDLDHFLTPKDEETDSEKSVEKTKKPFRGSEWKQPRGSTEKISYINDESADITDETAAARPVSKAELAKWDDGEEIGQKSVQRILKEYLKGDATEKELAAVQGTGKPEKLDDKASSKAVKERAKKVDKK